MRFFLLYFQNGYAQTFWIEELTHRIRWSEVIIPIYSQKYFTFHSYLLQLSRYPSLSFYLHICHSPLKGAKLNIYIKNLSKRPLPFV